MEYLLLLSYFGSIYFDITQRDEKEISPSTIFATASVLEGCSYINGSPQNTFVPGVMELAERNNVFIVGDDFKSGKKKSKLELSVRQFYLKWQIMSCKISYKAVLK